MAGSPKSPEDLVSSSSESSQIKVDDSNLCTASGDCLLYSDMDDALVQSAHKSTEKEYGLAVS